MSDTLNLNKKKNDNNNDSNNSAFDANILPCLF